MLHNFPTWTQFSRALVVYAQLGELPLLSVTSKARYVQPTGVQSYKPGQNAQESVCSPPLLYRDGE